MVQETAEPQFTDELPGGVRGLHPVASIKLFANP
jgi:hypothetical protein